MATEPQPFVTAATVGAIPFFILRAGVKPDAKLT
jgi:hypothetical protein